MISSIKSIAPAAGFVRRRLILVILSLLGVGGFSVSLRAQNATPPADSGNANADTGGGRRRGNFNPDAMMDNLRKQMGVDDDAEWSVISGRITAVMTLARGAGGRFGGGRGGGGRGGSPELQALRSAVTNNMPDAEIKARLERLREVRKDDQAKLEKAQADLQAVLSVKQEAVAVMLGLLP